MIIAVLSIASWCAAAELGGQAVAFKRIASLANSAVEEGALPVDSGLDVVDRILIDRHGKSYHDLAGGALTGLKIFAVESPKTTAKLVVGFTEPSDLSFANVQGMKVQGRYVFLWEGNSLRAWLFEEEPFEKLIAANNIATSEAKQFDFPALRELERQFGNQPKIPSISVSPPVGRRWDEPDSSSPPPVEERTQDQKVRLKPDIGHTDIQLTWTMGWTVLLWLGIALITVLGLIFLKRKVK